MHIGMLQTNTFRVGCNGLVYIRNGEAVIMDTPIDSVQSLALLRWIENVFRNHCKSGYCEPFFMTIALPVCPSFTGKAFHLMPMQNKNPAAEKGVPEPQNGFSGQWDITVGGQKIESRFLGEAHTKDNIVTWIPSEHILFGGCQVKSRQ